MPALTLTLTDPVTITVEPDDVVVSEPVTLTGLAAIPDTPGLLTVTFDIAFTLTQTESDEGLIGFWVEAVGAGAVTTEGLGVPGGFFTYAFALGGPFDTYLHMTLVGTWAELQALVVTAHAVYGSTGVGVDPADVTLSAVSITNASYTLPLPVTVPTITLNTLDARTREGLTIHDVLNDAPNTCTLTVETGTVSPLGKAVRIATQDPVLLFTGTIQTVDLSYDLRADALRWACTATDDLAWFNRRLPFGTWTGVSATDVAQSLVASFAPDFSDAGIAASLPAVSVRYDRSTPLATVFADLAQLIGGAFKVEDGVVYLFLTDTVDPPDDIDDTPGRFLDDPPITMRVDLSQMRTRAYVRGAGSAVAGAPPLPGGVPTGSLTPTTGGALIPWTSYGYQITNISADGESISVGGSGTTLLGTHNAMLLGDLDSTIPTDPRVTGRNIYRTHGAGSPGHGLIATLGNVAGIGEDTFLDTVDGDLLDGTAPPLLDTSVTIYTMVEDTVAQAALAALEGGGSDGIVEHYITDPSLLTTAQATARGNAELALFAYPLVTVTYATRDLKTKSGKTVHFDVTNPPISGDLLIQDVTISHLDLVGGPIFQVTASSVRFSLEAILRMALKRVA
jgi:hypothetical protein